MPQKNSIKHYYEDGFYHIYNRGVEKRKIFLDRDDFLMFLHFLKTALSESPKQGATLAMAPKQSKHGPRKNFHQRVTLLAYCLVPNHFHLLIKQSDSTAMTEMIRSVCTAYGMYFNKKYDRVGSLFQGVFKAIDIAEDDYLLWLSRYIHRNPESFRTYLYSSYGDYLGTRQSEWTNTKIILDYFSNSSLKQKSNYQKFVDDDQEEPTDLPLITIEKEE